MTRLFKRMISHQRQLITVGVIPKDWPLISRREDRRYPWSPWPAGSTGHWWRYRGGRSTRSWPSVPSRPLQPGPDPLRLEQSLQHQLLQLLQPGQQLHWRPGGQSRLSREWQLSLINKYWNVNQLFEHNIMYYGKKKSNIKYQIIDCLDLR